MLSRSKLKQSPINGEEEEAHKQKVHEQKLQEKKELLRTEFQASQLDREFDLSEELISSKNELKFKSLLNEITTHRQSLSKTYTFLQKHQSTHIHSTSSSMSSKSLESFDNILLLQNRLSEISENERKVSERISIESLKMESNQLKVSEYEKSIQMLKEKNIEHNYCLSLYDKRFHEMKGVLCAAKNRKFRGETNLRILEKDFNEKKELEKELLMVKFKLTKESKVRIKTDEEMIGNVMIHIDEKKMKLQETNIILENLKIQEDEIRFKRDQIHNMKNYLEVLKELEATFLNSSEPLIMDLSQNKDNIIDEKKKSISLCLDNPNKKRGKTTFDKSPLRLIEEVPVKAKKKYSFSHPVQYKLQQNEILGKIEKFFESHPLGILDLINKLINVHQKLAIQSQSLQRNYSEKIKMKSEKEGELLLITNQCRAFSKNLTYLSENPNFSSPQTFNILNSREPQVERIYALAKQSKKYSLFIIHIQIFLENAFLRLAQNLKLVQKISKDVSFEIISFVESFLSNKKDFLRNEDKLREITQFSLNNISETFESTWYIDTPKQLKEIKRNYLKKEVTFDKKTEECIDVVVQDTDLKKIMEEMLFEKEESLTLQKNILSSVVMQSLQEKVLVELLLNFEKADLLHNFEKVELEAFNLITDELKHQLYMFEELIKKINYYIKEVPEKENKINDNIVTNSEIKEAHLKIWNKLSKDFEEKPEEETNPSSKIIIQHEESNYIKGKLEQSQLLSMIGREKNYRSPFFKKTEKKIQLHDKDNHLQRRISIMEKDATEEEFLELTRLRIKTPEYRNFFSETKDVPEGKLIKRAVTSINGSRKTIPFLRDMHADFAMFGQLQRSIKEKIERISSKVDNVSDLHYSLLKNKRIANSTFKQSSISKTDRSDFHFLTPSKAYSNSRSSKKTSSIFTKRFESENNHENEQIKTPNSFHYKIKSLCGKKQKRRRINTISGELIKETNYWLNSPKPIQNNIWSTDYNILFHRKNLEEKFLFQKS